MRYLAILAFLSLIAVSAQGQTVSVAPISVPAWGQTENTRMIEASYHTMGLHYFNKPGHHNFAISYRRPLSKYFRAGLITFIREFPNPQASRINLWLDVGIDIGKIRISYVHVSNIFLADRNPGYDAILVSVPLY